MYCPFCGATLESCPAFCSACGKNVKFLKDKVPDGNEQAQVQVHSEAVAILFWNKISAW